MTDTSKKKHTTEDSIAEMTAVREAMNAGSWRIVLPVGSQAVPAFVKDAEIGQYNLMTTAKYKSEQNAALALALTTRPTQLTHQERVALLGILENKE